MMQRAAKYRQVINGFVNRFTTIPLVGLDLDSTVVKVVELAESNGKFVLSQCQCVERN